MSRLGQRLFVLALFTHGVAALAQADGGTPGLDDAAVQAADAGVPADGTAATTEEDLAAIEAALGADAAATEPAPPAPATPTAPPNAIVRAVQSMNPDLAFIADIAFAWFSSRDPLQTGDTTRRSAGSTSSSWSCRSPRPSIRTSASTPTSSSARSRWRSRRCTRPRWRCPTGCRRASASSSPASGA